MNNDPDLDELLTLEFMKGAQIRDLAEQYFSNTFASQMVQDSLRRTLKGWQKTQGKSPEVVPDGTLDRIVELESQLKTQMENQQSPEFWIDYSGEKPAETGVYFVRRVENPIPTARNYDGKKFRTSATVTHWAKVPGLLDQTMSRKKVKVKKKRSVRKDQ